MEIDLLNSPVDLKNIKPREIEEALEDPFALKFLPDTEREDGESRFFALGRSVGGACLFICFATDGKKAKLVAIREMSEDERRFYERRYAASI